MTYELNTIYPTRNNNNAVILYTMPSDIVDEYPYVGYVQIDSIKLGMCWSKSGEAAEGPMFDMLELV